MDNYKIDRERWARLTFYEQMGNIGSEVGRAIIAHRNNNIMRETRAIFIPVKGVIKSDKE